MALNRHTNWSQSDVSSILQQTQSEIDPDVDLYVETSHLLHILCESRHIYTIAVAEFFIDFYNTSHSRTTDLSITNMGAITYVCIWRVLYVIKLCQNWGMMILFILDRAC